MTTRQQVNHFRQSVDYHFEGKVALIMGASRGIRAATVQLFAQEGATVVLASRSGEELARIVEEVEQLYQRRERYGFSYDIVTDQYLQTLAPVVAQLTGKA